jgi:hypothetical protein
VLALDGGAVARVTNFKSPGLFRSFGLPDAPSLLERA